MLMTKGNKSVLPAIYRDKVRSAHPTTKANKSVLPAIYNNDKVRSAHPTYQALNLPPFAGSDQSQEKPFVSGTN